MTLPKYCPNCGAIVEQDVATCPVCNADIPTATPETSPPIDSQYGEPQPQTPAVGDQGIWPPSPYSAEPAVVAAPFKLLTRYPALDYIIGFGVTFGLNIAFFLGYIAGVILLIKMPLHKYIRQGVLHAMVLVPILIVLTILGWLAVCFYSIGHAGR